MRIHLLITIFGFATWGDTFGGQHFADAAAQRVLGCIDGQCGPPVSPHGYYQGSWRRWPNSKDTPVVTRPPGLAPLEPVVPEPVDEGRTRRRTRSDRPLDPEDMGVDTGMNAQPFVPDPTDNSNPFNNVVDESDLPNSPAGVDAGTNGAAGPDLDNDPLFAPPQLDNSTEEDGNSLFDIPVDPGSAPPAGDDTGFDSPADLFDQSGLPSAPAKQFARRLAARSIKSRGVHLQARGKLTTTSISAKPGAAKIVTSPTEDKTDTEKNPAINLTSYNETTSNQEALSESPAPIAPLLDEQIRDAEKLPSAGGLEDRAATASHDLTFEGSNPLRRGSMNQALSSGSQHSKTAPLSSPPSTIPVEASTHQSPVASKRSLSQAVAHRSLRDTIRRNPLR